MEQLGCGLWDIRYVEEKTRGKIFTLPRWWQLKYFWNVHPEPWGRFSPILTSIIFQLGWETTTNQLLIRFLLRLLPLTAILRLFHQCTGSLDPKDAPLPHHSHRASCILHRYLGFNENSVGPETSTTYIMAGQPTPM